jgi:hypothetical protein
LLKGETFDRCGPSLTRARAFLKFLRPEYLLLPETLLSLVLLVAGTIIGAMLVFFVGTVRTEVTLD